MKGSTNEGIFIIPEPPRQNLSGARMAYRNPHPYPAAIDPWGRRKEGTMTAALSAEIYSWRHGGV